MTGRVVVKRGMKRGASTIKNHIIDGKTVADDAIKKIKKTQPSMT